MLVTDSLPVELPVSTAGLVVVDTVAMLAHIAEWSVTATVMVSGKVVMATDIVEEEIRICHCTLAGVVLGTESQVMADPIWPLVTRIFVHANIVDLLGNCLGCTVEQTGKVVQKVGRGDVSQAGTGYCALPL